ncbi:MAG: DUF2156 domain-containing protein [Nitrospirae bacterium]|nr:DUF2156 domain-containing protein [Nitrospirota bacterium]MCL5285227.1 DUF2156 domain-containing protein [Nitrospirota bacterium]
MTGRRRILTSDRLRDHLSSFGDLPFSWRHPASQLLFSDRLTFFLSETRTAGEILMGETADGVLFLPLPPPLLLRAEAAPSDRERLLRGLFGEMAAMGGRCPAPFLENCPLGSLPSGSFRIEPSEREYLVSVSSLLDPRGWAGRSFRWERNRFFRDHPSVRIRPVESGDDPFLRRFVRDFVRERTKGVTNTLESLMAEDMGRAFERAQGLWRTEEIEGWVLEEGGRILGLEWYGRLPGGETLVCLLEARDPGVSNLGGIMTRLVIETSGAGVRWVNLMGGSGIVGVERAKRARPHHLVLPLFRVVPA